MDTHISRTSDEKGSLKNGTTPCHRVLELPPGEQPFYGILCYWARGGIINFKQLQTTKICSQYTYIEKRKAISSIIIRNERQVCCFQFLIRPADNPLSRIRHDIQFAWQRGQITIVVINAMTFSFYERKFQMTYLLLFLLDF